MNKQEIIKRLQELPDGLPVIFYRYDDSKTPIGEPIKKIEVVKAFKSWGLYKKYDSLFDTHVEEHKVVDVIWIS
jgi:hypothetical protein